jgi:hypothetical protein
VVLDWEDGLRTCDEFQWPPSIQLCHVEDVLNILAVEQQLQGPELGAQFKQAVSDQKVEASLRQAVGRLSADQLRIWVKMLESGVQYLGPDSATGPQTALLGFLDPLREVLEIAVAELDRLPIRALKMQHYSAVLDLIRQALPR